MKIIEVKQELQYPYLAVYKGKYENKLNSDININEILVISLINRVNEIYVQHLVGGIEGHFITPKEESDFIPLPKGYKLEIIQ